MDKTLFKITHLKDGICAAEIHTEDKMDMERICAAILSLMDRNEAFARNILNVAGLYLMHREELGEVNKAALRGAEIKLKN